MNIEIVSIHVPKTAGTSFHKVLQGVYGTEAVFHDDGRHYCQRVDEMPLEPWHRVIHGHVWAGHYKRLLPTARLVTWVRHPVNWLISLYGFLDSLPPNDNPAWVLLKNERPSLLEFAASKAVRTQTQSRFLHDVGVYDFFFVGIQEHFAEDLYDLGGLMNWRGVTPSKENANAFVSRFRANVWRDRALVEGICDRLEDDMKLYEAAELRRDRRVYRAMAA